MYSNPQYTVRTWHVEFIVNLHYKRPGTPLMMPAVLWGRCLWIMSRMSWVVGPRRSWAMRRAPPARSCFGWRPHRAMSPWLTHMLGRPVVSRGSPISVLDECRGWRSKPPPLFCRRPTATARRLERSSSPRPKSPCIPAPGVDKPNLVVIEAA